MRLLDKLAQRWQEETKPFLIRHGSELTFDQLLNAEFVDLSCIQPGDVVALIGDFEPRAIATFLRLIDHKAIIVPLTEETRHEHDYFLDAAQVDVLISGAEVKRVRRQQADHPLPRELRNRGHAGLVLFSTGTTGRPKAILHDMTRFLLRYDTPRPALRTISFLMFDHIGGINTLLHTLFNRGTVTAPPRRTVASVLETCRDYHVELLPTTPTFLRMMLMSGMIPDAVPSSLKIITYGTERMDQPTLDQLCEALPEVDFRQTFGMSELGIVRVKSESRNSLFMRVGGEGIETRIVDNVLHIRSANRMLGYLNAESPFDDDGWYNTKDIVETKGEFIKVVGRDTEAINVGGLKFMASDVEQVALRFPGVAHAKAVGRANPLTGQHVELSVQPRENVTLDKKTLGNFLSEKLPRHMQPQRLKIGGISVGHRFKRL